MWIIIIVGTYVIYKYITRAHSWGMANSIGNIRISKGHAHACSDVTSFFRYLGTGRRISLKRGGPITAPNTQSQIYFRL